MTDLYQQGHSPDDALRKVAQQHDLTPHQLRIVGRGFNSGQTLTEVRNGATLAEKTAGARKLANIEGVISGLYTGKKAKLEAADDAVADVYGSFAAKPMGKAAAVEAPVEPTRALPSEDAGRPPLWVAPHLYSEYEKRIEKLAMRKRLQKVDRDAAVAETRVKTAGASLRQHVGELLGQPEKIAQLRSDAKRFHGELGLQILDEKIASFTLQLDQRGGRRSVVRLAKQAQAAESPIRTFPSTPDHPLLQKVAACCDACGRRDKAQRNQIASRMLTAKMHRLIDGHDSPPRTITADAGSIGKKAEAYLQKFAISVGGMLGGLVASRAKLQPGTDPSSSSFRAAELEVADPQHEQELKNIRLRASLQGLMDYDPVIQAYDPEEVLTAFNELSQSTPAALDNPVMLRASLRRMLQGDVAPFEAAQFSKSEQDIRKLIQPLTAQV